VAVSISLIDDLKFTYGICVENTYIPINVLVNINKVHNISFEFVHRSLVNDLDADILQGINLVSNTNGTVSSLSYTDGSSIVSWTDPLSADTDLHKIKYIRNHTSVSLYINEVFISTKQLTTNNDFIFNELLSSGVYDRIGNIKITSGDNILHWWKLNSIINNELFDEGLNDIDFYTYWYSIAYLFAILIKSDQELLDIVNNIEQLRKFIETKGIYISSDISNDDLLYIYQNWITEFEKRGTERMYLPKQDTILGRCIQTFYTPVTGNQFQNIRFYNSSTTYNLGKSLEFSFKWKPDDYFSTATGNVAVLENLDIQNTGGDNYQFTYFGDTNARWVVEIPQYEVSSIKLIRDGTQLWLIVSDVNQGEKPYAANNDHTIGGSSSNYIIEGRLGRIAELKIKWDTDSLYWPMTESDGTNCLEIKKELLDDLIIDSSIDYTATSTILDVIRIVDNDFNNIVPVFVDGEVLRLLGYSPGDEFIIGKIRNPELGWYLGTSSPCSHQSFPIWNLNKSYDKQPDIENHFNYPEIPKTLIRTEFDDKICFGLDVLSVTTTDVYNVDMSLGVLVPISTMTYKNGLSTTVTAPFFKELNIGTDYIVEMETYIGTADLNGTDTMADDSVGSNSRSVWLKTNAGDTSKYDVSHMGADFVAVGITGVVQTIRLERIGINVSLYINNALIGSDTVNSASEDYTIDDAVITNGDSIIIGNISIIQNNIKTHWWKCNEVFSTLVGLSPTTFGDILFDLGYHDTINTSQIGIHSDYIDRYKYTNPNIYILIDEELSYEVSFMLYFPNDTTFEPHFIDFGITGYDENFINITGSFLGVETGNQTDSFMKYTKNDGFLDDGLNVITNKFHDIRPEFQTGAKGSWVFFRGIIYGNDVEVGDREDKLNLGFGENLIFNNIPKYIVPNIRVISTSEIAGGLNTFYLHNINIRPLKLPVGKGILASKNVFINYLKNKDRFSETEISDIMGKQLFPYNAFIKNKYI